MSRLSSHNVISLYTGDVSSGARPIQVVLAKSDHTFELDTDSLENILLSDEVKDKKVVVVSVAGAFRKGKSFLLDFFIRYLNAMEAEVKVGLYVLCQRMDCLKILMSTTNCSVLEVII